MTVILDGTAGITSVTGSAATAVAGPTFGVYQTSGQSVPNNSSTKISYDTKDFDTNGCFNNTNGTVTLNGISVPAYSFAPNVAGYYIFTWLVGLPSFSGGTNEIQANLVKNGSTPKNGNDQVSGGTSHYTSTGNSVILKMNGTSDYVYVTIYQNTGGALTSIGTGDWTYFTGSLLRGL